MRALIIGQESADTALIRLASEAEAVALMRQRAQPVNVMPARIDRPLAEQHQLIMQALSEAQEVYVRTTDGEFVPFGVLETVERYAQHLDVTSYGDASPRYAPMPMGVRFSGRGMQW